jgi:TetR/AcrR family transcriptional repressor of nem operon
MYEHSSMNKLSNREKILNEGLRVVHEHGFSNASVRDIVQAAGVPQGSFTNHFASKEAFGLEIINIYFDNNSKLISETLLNDALPPIERLDRFIDSGKNCLNENNMRNGCLLGNFAAEATDSSETMRLRLLEVFGEIQASIAYCLNAAVKTGSVSSDINCEETAAVIVSSLQGANLLAKTCRSPEPVERFKKILFSKILR